MPDYAVVCGEAREPESLNALHLALRGPRQTFKLQINAIEKALASRVPDRLVDLLEIAAYVFAADRSIKRGGEKRENWGEAWRRSMKFTIPVRDLAFWQRDPVSDALSAALRFLLDDLFAFEFVAAEQASPLQDYLPWPKNL